MVVSTNTIDSLERPFSEMTWYVSGGMYNPTNLTLQHATTVLNHRIKTRGAKTPEPILMKPGMMMEWFGTPPNVTSLLALLYMDCLATHGTCHITKFLF